MRRELDWINDALADKDLVVEMTYYRVAGEEIQATDGRITAGHPWPYGGEFLIPGKEFEKILSRMPDEPTLQQDGSKVTIKCGRFRGTLETLDEGEWNYPGVEGDAWEPLTEAFLDTLEALRPFVSDNATRPWATCYALKDGWTYATNNVALAGMDTPSTSGLNLLLPTFAMDFVLARRSGLTHWMATPNFIAFLWENGAWMRSQLVQGDFPDKAAELVRAAAEESPPTYIDEDFRKAVKGMAELSPDVIDVFEDRIVGEYKRATVEDGVGAPVPEGKDRTRWGTKYLLPVIDKATHWDPTRYPSACPFASEQLVGYVMGRN